MAYIALAGKSLTTKEITAAEIVTQMLAMGWTLYDDMSASYYNVLRSNGEAGTRPWLYIQVNWSGTSVTMIVTCHWNATTHATASTPTYANNYLYIDKRLWMHGNKDFVVIAQESAGVMGSKAMFGHVVSLPATAVNTTTTATITAGTTKDIPLTSVTGFSAGARYQIFDPTTGYRQTFLCTSVNASSITADSILSVGYASGSLLGTHPFPVIIGVNTLIATLSQNHHRCLYNGAASTADNVTTSVSKEMLALGIPYMGTAVKRGFYAPICVETGNSPVSYHLMGTMDDGNGFIYNTLYLSTANANDAFTAADFDAIYVGSNDTGTTTGSNTVTTMADTTKAWTTNQWAGKVLVLTSGTEIGQVRKIVSNTATVLTITGDFSVIPISGAYVIADRGYRHYLASTVSILLREGV